MDSRQPKASRKFERIHNSFPWQKEDCFAISSSVVHDGGSGDDNDDDSDDDNDDDDDGDGNDETRV